MFLTQGDSSVLHGASSTTHKNHVIGQIGERISVIFPQIIHKIVPYFLPIKFFSSVILKTLLPATAKCTVN